MLTIDDLPDRKLTPSGKSNRQAQPLTVRNVALVLEDQGIGVRLNMMTGSVAYTLQGMAVPFDDEPGLFERLSDVLVRLDIHNLNRLDGILGALACESRYHPMADWLTLGGVRWDGVDRIAALAATVTTDTELWPVFLENWMVQVVEGVCGWAHSRKKPLDCVLVLVGGQGVGKTHWLRQLGCGFIKSEMELHLSSNSGKDHQIEALRWPMVELSELDGIFKRNDINQMKSFISRDEDTLRVPYARRAITRARMTTFCASVNSPEFLSDTSGSRRFWPVEVDAIARDGGVGGMDWRQLWRQAYEYWLEAPAFALSAAQEAQRAGDAYNTHTMITREVEKLSEYYRRHQHLTASYRPMNRSEILEMLGFHNAWTITVKETGDWLATVLGKHKTIDGKQRCWLFPYSAVASDAQIWPALALVPSPGGV